MGAEPDALTAAWREAEAALPEGWRLDALRCASSGLAEEERSGEWIAVAIGPDGRERWARAPDPFAALQALADATR